MENTIINKIKNQKIRITFTTSKCAAIERATHLLNYEIYSLRVSTILNNWSSRSWRNSVNRLNKKNLTKQQSLNNSTLVILTNSRILINHNAPRITNLSLPTLTTAMPDEVRVKDKRSILSLRSSLSPRKIRHRPHYLRHN